MGESGEKRWTVEEFLASDDGTDRRFEMADRLGMHFGQRLGLPRAGRFVAGSRRPIFHQGPPCVTPRNRTRRQD